MNSVSQPLPIRSQFSGGTDFDNEIAVSGLTFEEAMQVVELLGRIVKARREQQRQEAASPPATGTEAEGQDAQRLDAEHDGPVGKAEAL